MNIAIRYQSRTGHTKAVAEAMGKALSVKAEDISAPIKEPVDVLFIGGGLYAFQTDPALTDFMKNLDSTKVKTIVVYSTFGAFRFTQKRLTKIAKRRKFHVYKEPLLLKVPPESTVTKEQLAQAEAFAKDVIRKTA